MNYILTRYIFPLPELLTLSHDLNLSLDNPRSEEEVEALKKYIEYSHDPVHATFDHHWALPVISGGTSTLSEVVRKLVDRYSRSDAYISKIGPDLIERDPHEALARMWIILRFDDEGTLAELKRAAADLKRQSEGAGFFLLNDNHPLIKNAQHAEDYSCLLSLLSHSEGQNYEGRTFLLHEHWRRLQPPKLDRWLNQTILSTAFFLEMDDPAQDDTAWTFFPAVRDTLLASSTSLDRVLDESSREKLLHVGHLLSGSGPQTRDYKVRFVTLVSALELLLAHSPDLSRFNVEDSISKQFVLKTSLLVYLNDPTQDLAKLKKRVHTIYTQRSNIAHGNYRALTKFIKNQSASSDEVNPLEDLVCDTYTYLRAVIEQYIRDRKLVEFLKDN